MFVRNVTMLMNLLPIFIILMDFKCSLSMPRTRYKVYHRSKPPFPPVLSFSPPRMSSAQNFHSDYAAPPFLMNGPPSSSYGPPGPSYDQPPNMMDYETNGIQTEYGPPTTPRPGDPGKILKHIYVHIPPPEPDTPVMR